MSRILSVVLIIFLMSCSKAPSLTTSKCTLVPGQDITFSSGKISLGELGIYPEESGHKIVDINQFSISATEVTNMEFQRFVDATGYKTRAERGLDATVAPELPEELRIPGAMVFAPHVANGSHQIEQLWVFVPGANWKHPFGPDSDIQGKELHPVIQMTYEDAVAYTKWANRRLPSEAEWEYAARNAGNDLPVTQLKPPNSANTWQGEFPYLNAKTDGYSTTSPVGCFEPTEHGLYDMLGNVWEITDSTYYPGHQTNGLESAYEQGYAPGYEGAPLSVLKGGSYLCAENFCARYRPEARQPQDKYLASSHIGFRTVSVNN